METTAQTVPEGYMRDSRGRLTPVDMVKQIDQERDALVREIVKKAQELSEELRQFKLDAMGDLEAFVDLSAEKYGTKLGGSKGNLQLNTYDGQYRIRVAISENLAFDERLQAAKALIDECIHKWSAGSRSEIQTLINDAFDVDQEGRINTKRVLSLRRLDIADPQWQQAMQAISDSVQVVGSKSYLRIYERQADGSYRQLNLDIASL